jgi:leader peptidase (prepilin peptidase) / N-methyltransferase
MIVATYTEIFLVVFLGLILGSFATALTWRVPRNISWQKAKGNLSRSACPKCKKTLGAIDLVPIFSWLLLRGKCRYCKAAIGWQYPAVEVLTVTACLGAYFAFGLSVTGFLFILAIPFLVALLAIDIEHMILPDQLVLTLAVLGVISVIMESLTYGSFSPVLSSVIGAVLFGGTAWLLRKVMGMALKKEALGFGDVKFFAVAGLWLGAENLPYFMLLSGVLGVLFGLIWRAAKGHARFPFGPALIVSFYILLIFDLPLYLLP